MHTLLVFMHIYANILHLFNGVLAPEYNKNFSSNSFGHQLPTRVQSADIKILIDIIKV